MRVIVFVAVAATMGFSSCTKEINIDLNSSDPKIVIEGDITDEPGPYFVKISKTVNFSEANNYPGVSNALVIVSDNTGTIDTLSDMGSGIYKTAKIVGTPGNTYNLSVTIDGKSYSASSTMPAKVSLDSIRFNLFSGPGGSTDNYTVIPVFLDPATRGNAYRFLQTVDGELDGSYIVINDYVTNGTVNQRPIFSQGVEAKLGKSITVEMRCIDAATYTYFYALSQIAGGGPGGGTTPSNPPNNISGNMALGLFTAYTTQKVTQIVK